MDLLSFAAGAALGLMVGATLAATRVLALMRRRRALAGTSAALARMWPETLPQRTAADILAGRIRIVLGGVRYDLTVKSRRAAREWIASLDERFALLASALTSAETPEILQALAAETDALYDLLTEYAGPDVLPARDSEADNATEAEILRAVLEVWAALHPLAVALVAASAKSPTSGSSPESPSFSPMPTAGDRTTSTST